MFCDLSNPPNYVLFYSMRYIVSNQGSLCSTILHVVHKATFSSYTQSLCESFSQLLKCNPVVLTKVLQWQQVNVKNGKNSFRVFSDVKSHVIITVIIFWHSTMMTGSFASKNTINEFLPFSTFNCCHSYTSVKTTVFLHKYMLLYYHSSFGVIRFIDSTVYAQQSYWTTTNNTRP